LLSGTIQWVIYLGPGGILNQQRQEAINAKIEEIYLIDGLDEIASDLTKYGTICVTSIDEIRRDILIGYTQEDLLDLIKNMNSRNGVRDIIEFNYESSQTWYKLTIFGRPTFNAILHGFQTFSYLLQDVVITERAIWISENVNSSEMLGNLQGAAILCQDIELFLTQKLQELTLIARSRHLTSWSDLKLLKNTDDIKIFQKELEEFNELWIKWWDSEGEERQRLSNELHNWLIEHTFKN